MMLPLLMLLMSASISTSEMFKIDWTRCLKISKCYEHGATKGEMVRYQGEIPGHDCPIGLQTYFFSDDLALFQWQVGIDDTNAIVTRVELWFGDHLLFGCTKQGDDKAEIVQDELMKERHKPELFEDRSIFEKNNAFCAIKLSYMTKFLKSLEKKVTKERIMNNQYSIRYATLDDQQLEKINFAIAGDELGILDQSLQRCDAYSFKDIRSDDNYHVRKVMNRDLHKLDCSYYKDTPYKYTLRLKIGNDESSTEIGSMECDSSTQNYKYTTGGSSDVQVLDKPDDSVVFCAVELNRTCVDPFIGSGKAPKFEPGSDAQVATLKCPDDKWLIDNKTYYTFTAENQPVCKRGDYTPQNTAEFYTTVDGDELRLKIGPNNAVTASCFTEYDCDIKTELDYDECKDGEECKDRDKVDHASGTIKCHGGFQLRVPIGDKKLTPDSITCDVKNGNWVMAPNNTNLATGTVVGCYKDFEDKKEATLSRGQMAGIIGGTVVFSILLAAIIGFFFYRFFKRRTLRGIEKMTKKKWIGMKTEERRKYAQFLFGTVTDPKPGTLVQITHGLDALEMLLDTETEDAEVWEEVWLFLSRLQGALAALDYSVHHSFTRFVYLAAKKIIDRHGWVAPKRITKAHPQGLIRCVAIQLLARCYGDRYYEDAETLVADGYAELGLQAVEQYPHCGLLWSLMTQVRQQKHSSNTGPNLPAHSFDLAEFCIKLNEFVTQPNLDIPKTDVIPQFESVSMQAAFALGSTHNYVDLIDDVYEMFEKKEGKDGSLTNNYMLGMGYSMCTNPGPKIFVATRSLGDLKAALLAIAPESLWEPNIDVIVRIMVDYYRSLDAKRLQDKCMPGVDEEFIINLKSSQRLFEGAARKQMEDLRDWFATRIDVEELKKQPEALAVLPETSVKNRKRDRSSKSVKAKKKPAPAPVPAPVPTSSSSTEAAPPPVAAEAAPLLPPPSQPSN